MATDWYVDGLNGERSNHGTVDQPFVSPWQAMKVARPGDTIHVLPTVTYKRLAILASGTPGNPITVVGGDAPNRTRVANTGEDGAIWIDADYVVVSNFDASAEGQKPAFSIAPYHHHVTLSWNTAHDSGAAGFTSFADDYIRISNNVVYGNAHNTAGSWQSSGISLLGAVDSDDYTGVKNMIVGNIVYANTNTPNCAANDKSCLARWLDSDGSGIILDDFMRKRFDSVAYRGRTLIANNVVFGNGGRGIYMYRSLHASIIGNTVYSNNQDPYEGNWHAGEIGLNEVGDISIYNNILYNDGGHGVNRTGTEVNTHFSVSIEHCSTGSGKIIVHSNLMFDPQDDDSRTVYLRDNDDTVLQSDNIWANPRLKKLSLDPQVADFRPMPGSPALDSGDPDESSTWDILRVRRGGLTSMGAYEEAVD